MLNFRPSDEELAIAQTVRDFVSKELKPLEANILQRGANGGPEYLIPEEHAGLRERAKNAGLWGIDTPEEYGGADLNWVAQLLIESELRSTFVSFTFGGSAPEVLYTLGEEHKERYLVPTIEGEKVFCFALSEPGAGSDARNLRTTAVKSGDDWIINGEKTWISWGNEADYALVFCRTVVDGEERGITSFLIDREAGWTSTPIALMGASHHRVATLSFQDVRVPDSARAGDVGAGFSTALQTIYRGRAIEGPALAIGVSQRLIEFAIEHANNRVTFGKPLAERENIKMSIAECEVELQAMKLLALNAAWRGDTGGDLRHLAAVNKYYAGTMVNRVVDRVMQIHGAMGYSREMPIEHWYRDVRVLRILEGTDEINLMTVGRNLLKGYVKPGAVY
ncbi:acyl-CoA dehydrogenase family protein [Rhodococcus sp. C3V]|uniref:acyl-CoA dehydrogenase family protein n=1 Tax=Rhodococcus sp. C3V TaxID=3034165 RepID=UPI0023E1733D|nr:acyl-CoA dehydrogenase family protein [Rhodococcus sp. C3V]MDF3319976.1 acyl-CoA dehydrogenase family protein [Rhodococcus sp. C3V]